MVDAVEVEVELEETTVTLSVFERDHWQKLEDYGWIRLVDLDLGSHAAALEVFHHPLAETACLSKAGLKS